MKNGWFGVGDWLAECGSHQTESCRNYINYEFGQFNRSQFDSVLDASIELAINEASIRI